MQYQAFIEDSLKHASEIASAHFGKVTTTTKAGDNNQVLTEADIAIGNYLVGQVREHFSGHNIIDEEAGVIDNKSEFTWVIDPIDGTSNFANGLPMYGIMVGLLQGGNSIVGGIALPFFNEIYTAEKGQGTVCGGRKMKVTEETDLLKVLVGYCIDGHQENPELTREEAKLLGEIVLSIRNLRTSNSAFDAVQIAKGNYGGLMNRTSKIWDNVAQQIIIEEAGGVYTDFFGKPMDYSHPLEKAALNFTFCTGAPTLHEKLQQIIRISG